MRLFKSVSLNLLGKKKALGYVDLLVIGVSWFLVVSDCYIWPSGFTTHQITG